MKPKTPAYGSFWWLIQTPGTRTYLIMGVAAILVVFLIMASKAGEIGALLIVLIALPGLLSGWVVSPALFLLLQTYLFVDPYLVGLSSIFGGYRPSAFGGQRGDVTRIFEIEMLLLAAASLLYLIAHFRLQGLAFRVLPYEPRIQRKGESEHEDLPRPPALVSDFEIGSVLAIAGIGTVLGQMGWWLLASVEQSMNISRDVLVVRVVGRLMLFAFVLGVSILISTAFFGYLRWLRMSRAEARMHLVDFTWHETRREQERIHRWRLWRRKRDGIAEGEVKT